MTNLVYQCYISDRKLPDFVTISTDSLKYYADKVSADYIFTRNTSIEKINGRDISAYFNILNIIYDKWFDQYDDILYVDCDVIADIDAQNIFEIERNRVIDIIAVPERRIPTAHFSPGFLDTERRKPFEEKYKFHSMDPYLNGTRKHIRQLNTGVILFTKKGRKKFRDNVEINEWYDWFSTGPQNTYLINDQPFLNANFDKHKFNVKELDDIWNQPAAWYKMAPCPKSHFYHFSNADKWFIKFFAHDHTPNGYYFHLLEHDFSATPKWGRLKS
jgi:lipopolysaccharide biosynthesis glycosyltransferase